MKLLVLAPFAERELARLRERFDVVYEPWTETKQLQDPDSLASRIRDEGIGAVVTEIDFLFEEAIEAPSLRLVAVCRNALHQVDIDAATGRGVVVTHAPGRNTVAVAEHAIGLMLSLARHVPQAHRTVMDGAWKDPLDAYARFRGRELAGSTVGIVGLGAIGSETARRVSCLGAKVLAHDPYVSKQAAEAVGARLVGLRPLLRRADFVSLHLPATRATERMIDASALALMKPDAYLVNTGAASALDHDALAEALRSRRIAGAGLDVFPGHPLPPSSPLLTLENVVLTPHIGGSTEETVERHSRMIADDIERFFAGKRPRHVANPEVLQPGRADRSR